MSEESSIEIQRRARREAAHAAGSRLFCAPGRVNLIGEHTDYNQGLVLPTNTALFTWVTIRVEPGRIVRVVANDLGEIGSFDLDDVEPRKQPGWIDYVRGVAAELEGEGVRLPGATLEIDGEIPMGGGLSSSASLEVALARAFLAVAAADLEPARIARLCQRAEQRFLGVQCGIMDPFSIVAGRQGKALLLDCRSLEQHFVAIPPGLDLLVVDSGTKHRLVDGSYNDRADECRRALACIAEQEPEVLALRDVDDTTLARHRGRLGDVLHRRVRHVVTENARVREAFEALQRGRIEEIASLVQASHESLRDDYEVSCPEVEDLVEVVLQTPRVRAARIVGAGFGGCILVLCESGAGVETGTRIAEHYGSRLGREPWWHLVCDAAPAREVAVS